MLPALPHIALALGGIEPPTLGGASAALSGGALVREKITWAAQRGVRAVQIDAMAAGVRPRELDRSGRRDLAALLRRSELACSGVDLFIPPEHFVQVDKVDRAVSAVIEAMEMASELSTLAAGAVVTRISSGVLPVCLVLPSAATVSVRRTLAEHAERRGARIADHAWPLHEQGAGDDRGIAVGLDPATILLAQQDPAQIAAQLGERIASARLTDVARGIGANRVAPGAATGRLDVLAYLVAIATGAKLNHVVLDLRGITDQRSAVAQVQVNQQ